MGAIERKIQDHRNRLIRIERCRWKIDTTRLNVIRGKRETAHGVLEKAKARRDVNYATTLVYENRAKYWDRENLEVEEFRNGEARRIENSLLREYVFVTVIFCYLDYSHSLSF